ncbi:ribonuclease HIII [bacterium]|nr:ribonuclease HIII [bacterium]
MGVYAKDDALSDYIERAYVEFMRLKIPFDSATIKEINYGVSFKVGEGKGAVSVAVYHTERKGFSIVTSDPKIRSILLSLLTETGTVGNDEAGKGDLFGPLVVCSFLLGESESELLKLHVTDSKKLKDAEIISIYEQVQKNFPNSFAALRMMPEKFNKAFEVATAKNQNSNHILAWSHARTIERLLARRRDAKRVLVDQFSESDFVNRPIVLAAGSTPVNFRVRAEQNPAVALASIVARAIYLKSLDEMNESLLKGKLVLTPGSGPDADTLLKKAVGLFGAGIIQKIAKANFANCAPYKIQ